MWWNVPYCRDKIDEQTEPPRVRVAAENEHQGNGHQVVNNAVGLVYIRAGHDEADYDNPQLFTQLLYGIKQNLRLW